MIVAKETEDFKFVNYLFSRYQSTFQDLYIDLTVLVPRGEYWLISNDLEHPWGEVRNDGYCEKGISSDPCGTIKGHVGKQADKNNNSEMPKKSVLQAQDKIWVDINCRKSCNGFFP